MTTNDRAAVRGTLHPLTRTPLRRLAAGLASAVTGALLVAGVASAAVLRSTVPITVPVAGTIDVRPPTTGGVLLPPPRPATEIRLLDDCPRGNHFVLEDRIRPLCAGTVPRVDETYTIYGNTVLQRTCGRFVTHTRGGNAGLELTSVVARPGLPPLTAVNRTDGWVLALRGCNLDKVDRVLVNGVPTEVIPASVIKAWHVPLATALDTAGSSRDAGGELAGGSQVAFVRFAPPATAHFHEDRTITVTWKAAAGGGPAPQKLKQIKLALADNGSVRNVAVKTDAGTHTTPQVRWAEETVVDFRGAQLRRARIRPGGCLASASITSSNESDLAMKATFDCPVVVPEDDGTETVVTARFCSCRMLAYDSSLDVYRDDEIAKQQFNYLNIPLNVFANLDKMNEKPAALGDSLSMGIMGVGLAPRSQLWAYPHVVVQQMGGRPLRQNLFYMSDIEDNLKGVFAPLYPGKYGPPVEPNHDQPTLEGFIDELGQLNPDELTTSPLHVGVDGFDYTNVLYTSGRSLDVRGGTRWRDGVEPPRCVCPEFCNDDGTPKDGVDPAELPRPAAQLALGCGERSPIEILEAEKPTFIFATAGNNHVLACATKMMAQDDCLEPERFRRDAAEVFRRLRKIGSIKGGVVFGIPPITSIPYFVPNGNGSLRAFWRRPNEATGDARVLNAAELAEVNAFIADANQFLRELAETNQYAYADSTAAFDRLRVQGEAIFDDGDNLLCSAHTVMPSETIDRGPEDEPQNAGPDAGCGLIGLDGVHPTQLGQTVISNELIRAIDDYYHLDVPELGREEIFDTWSADSLNQDPVDMRDFMTHDDLPDCGPALAAALGAVGTGTVCALSGGLCLETAALAAATAGGSEPCVTMAVQTVARSAFEDTIEKTVEPQICWPDQEHDYDGC